jgi:hypothetical protein
MTGLIFLKKKGHFFIEAFCEVDIVKFIITLDAESTRAPKERRTMRFDWNKDGKK